MKNGWKKLFIFSLIFILLEVIGTVLVMMPFYTRNMVFKNIEKGNSVKTKGYYDMLNDSGQDKVRSYLDDFGATLCQKYIDGKKTYEETMASLDSIKEIEGSNQIAEKYIKDVASNEYKKIIKEIYEADMQRDSNKGYTLKSKLDVVKQRLDNSTREKLMIEILNDKYKRFLAEEINGDGILDMCAIIQDNSYYEAYEYSNVIASNAKSVVVYRSLYSQMQDAYAMQDYLGILEKCNGITVDNWDENYKKLFDEMYTSAYEAGKEYYPGKVDEYIMTDNKAAAVELMKELEAVYGNDIDLKNAQNNLLSDWQQVYVDFIESFDASGSSHTINTVLLYDINDDDVPEMFLFDVAEIDNAYVGCEVYNINNGKCKSLGYQKVINICDDGYLITLPSSGGGDEAYALTYYDGETLTEGEDCKKVGDSYYVNGQDVNDADYLSVRTGILAHASAYTLKNSKNSDLEGAREYIMLFENKN